MNDGTPTPEFGEVETGRQVWNNGAFPAPLPPAVAIGEAACIEGGETTYGLPAGVNQVLGVDERCWTSQGLTPPLVVFDDGGFCLSDDSTLAHGYYLAGLADLVVNDGSELSRGAYLAGLADLVVNDGSELSTDGFLAGLADLVVNDGSALTGSGELAGLADLVVNDDSTLTRGGIVEGLADLVLSDSSTQEADLFILVHSETANKTVGNTNAETTLLNGSPTLPSAFVSAGCVLRLTAGGTVRFQNVASQVVTYRFKIGSTAVATMQITSTNAGPVQWWMQMDVTIRTTGSPGTASYAAFFACNVGTITVTTHNAASSTTTPTTASDPSLDFTAQWNTGATNNTTTQERVSIELFKS